MKKQNTRKVKMTKGERLLYFVGSLCLIGVLIVKIFLGIVKLDILLQP